MKSHEETMMLAELLNFHLGRSIEREMKMSDYADTAKRFKAMREARADRLKALNERMDSHESSSDEIFRSYEGGLDAMDEGMRLMEEEAREMKNDFEEKSDGGKTDKTVVGFPPGKTDAA